MGLNANQSIRLEDIIVSLTNNAEKLVELINELEKEDKFILIDLILGINHVLQKIRDIAKIDVGRYQVITRFRPNEINKKDN